MRQEQAVTLMRYVRTAKGWTRRKVSAGNTRGWEQRIDYTASHFGRDVIALGEYQIRWYENRKARYESGGDAYIQAMVALRERVNRLDLVNAAKRAGVTPPPEATDSRPLKDRIEPFIKRRKATGKITSQSTAKLYRLAINQFLEITKAHYIEQVTADTLIDFLTGLEAKGLEDRTRFNKYTLLATFLRSEDDGLSKLLRAHLPKVAEKKPVCYTPEDVEALLTFLRGQPRYKRLALVAEMYYKTGLRDKELAFLTWDKVDLKRGYLHIKNDQQFWLNVKGQQKEVIFHTKTRRDRSLGIPIEKGMLIRLRERRDHHPKDRFLFQTRDGNPDQGLLKKLRRATCRAGLTCGTCEACLRPCRNCQYCRCGKCKNCLMDRERACLKPHFGKHPCTRVQCRKWKLHRFRHTFATTAIRGGTDLSAVKDMLGQERLSTTQKYLSVVTEVQAKAAIDRVFGD
jgi:integrase/recombinase XerD